MAPSPLARSALGKLACGKRNDAASTTTANATAQPVKQEAFQPLPDGFAATPANDVAALERLFAEVGGGVAGMLIEPGAANATPQRRALTASL